MNNDHDDENSNSMDDSDMLGERGASSKAMMAAVAQAAAAAEAKFQKPKRGRPPRMMPNQELPPGTPPPAADSPQPQPKIRGILGNNNSPATNGGISSRRSLHHMQQQQLMMQEDGEIDMDVKRSPRGSKFLEPGEIMRPTSSMTMTGGKSTRSSSRVAAIAETHSGENSDASSTSSSTGKVVPQPPPPPPPAPTPPTRKSRKSFTSAPRDTPPPPPPPTQTPPQQPNFNQIDLAALANLFMAPGADPDERIAVINVEDGSRLQGNKAPKRGELVMWLMTHPNYLPDEQEIINMTMQSANMANLLQQFEQPAAATPTSSRRLREKQHQQQQQQHEMDEDDEGSPVMMNNKTPKQQQHQQQAGPNRPGLRSPHDSSPQQQQSVFDSTASLVLYNKVNCKRFYLLKFMYFV